MVGMELVQASLTLVSGIVLRDSGDGGLGNPAVRSGHSSPITRCWSIRPSLLAVERRLIRGAGVGTFGF